MIIFDKLWETMRNKGVSTYTLREQCNIDTRKILFCSRNASERKDSISLTTTEIGGSMVKTLLPFCYGTIKNKDK